MHRTARILSGLFVALASAAAFTPAMAAGAELKTTPMTIVSEGFEGQPLNYDVWYPAPTDVQWGPVTTRKRSGFRGLWCAGSTGLNPVPFVYPSYPYETSSWATFDVPADYYSSKVSFWYTMPSLAPGDDNSFVVRWQRDLNGTSQDERYPWAKTAVGTFKAASVDLDTGGESLSRRNGFVTFSFSDLGGPVGAYEGTTIDDVLINGWKYGPPRTATGASLPTGVRLQWDRPLGSTDANAALEDRQITYRIFRRPTGSTTWTDVGTSDGAGASVTFIDPFVAEGGPYIYKVQAVDIGGAVEAGYGQPSEDIAVNIPRPILAMTSPTPGFVSKSYTGSVRGTASDGGSGLSAVLVQITNGTHHWDGSAWVTGDPIYLDAPIVGNAWSLNYPASLYLPSADVTVKVKAVDDVGRFAVVSATSGLTLPPPPPPPPGPVATAFTALSGSKTLSYGKPGVVSATLSGISGPGVSVTLQRSSNGTNGWTGVDSKGTGGNGNVRFEVSASSMGYAKAYYRLTFAGSAGFSAASPSAVVAMDPKASLGKPWSSKKTVHAKKTYTWYSNIKPRHSAKSKPVKLQFERLVKGKYRAYKTVTATAYNYSSYSRVKASYKIPTKGKWRVRAFHDDAGHAPTYSAWLYKTVK